MNGGPNPLAALGLPTSWEPVPVGYAFATLDVEGPAGAELVHVLCIDTPTGRVGVAFRPAELEALRDALTRQISGIIAARPRPPGNYFVENPKRGGKRP